MQKNFLQNKILRFVESFRFPVFLSLFFLSCDTNFYAPSGSDPSSSDGKLEKARVLIDEGKYGDAITLLEELNNDSSTATNTGVLLLVAANLGIEGIDLWNILGDLMTNQSSSADIGEILAQASESTLGTGEEKTQKLAALQSAVLLLQNAPDPTEARLRNTSCYLGGLIVAPVLSDATTVLNNLRTQIGAISDNSCTASTFSTTLSEVASLSTQFSLVTQIVNTCSILSFDTSDVGSINAILGKLTEKADVGCSVPAGSESLFPSCFTSVIQDSGSANDNSISRCELVLNCINPTDCF